MPVAVWLGMLVGAALGVAYGLWQRQSLRSRLAGSGTHTALLMAAVRLATLMLTLGLLIRYSRLNRLAMLGGLAAAYALMLLWSLRTLWTRKR